MMIGEVIKSGSKKTDDMEPAFIVSTDKSRLDLNVIHEFLSTAYWSSGRSMVEVEKTISNSICFGAYLDGQQIGFARVLTDTVVVAYLMDVFILEDFRGRGYGYKLIQAILTHPELSEVKNWLLKTKDAHELYEIFGFTPMVETNDWMLRISQKVK